MLVLDKECCIQEAGLAGRDGGHSLALLMVIKGIRIYHTDASMHGCVKSTTCQRNSLLRALKDIKKTATIIAYVVVYVVKQFVTVPFLVKKYFSRHSVFDMTF